MPADSAKWFELWGQDKDDPEVQLLAKIPATNMTPAEAETLAKTFERAGYAHVSVREIEE